MDVWAFILFLQLTEEIILVTAPCAQAPNFYAKAQKPFSLYKWSPQKGELGKLEPGVSLQGLSMMLPGSMRSAFPQHEDE